MKKMSILATLLLALSSNVYAQKSQETYFGIQYGALNSDASFDDWDTGVLFGRMGMVLQPGLAVEGYFGLGIKDEDWTSANGCDKETVATDSILGAQIKGFTEGDISLHGSIGLNMVTASIEIVGVGGASCYGGAGFKETYDDTEIALSYGFGADFKINKNAAITADYQVFYNDDYAGVDLIVSGLLIGYKQSF